MRFTSCLLAAVLTVAALPAAAQSGWRGPGMHYFHRAGATMAQHDAAIRFCAGEAMKAQPNSTPMSGVNGGIAGAIIQSETNRSLVHANIETCMLVAGWTVIRPPAFDETGLKQASQQGYAAYVSKRVGLAKAAGTVVRRYDPAAPLTYRMGAFSAEYPESISFLAVYGSPGARIDLPGYKRPTPVVRSVRVADPANPTSGTAVIVVRTHGDRPGQQNVIRFMSIEDLPNGQPALTAFGTPTPTKLFWRAGTPMESLFVFEVPPGLWILLGDQAASYCLRAPVFEVKAGEVVFAGTFSSSIAGDMQPKMDLAPAKAGLPATFADRVRPAEWRNDISFDCGLVPSLYINALEIKGAPPA